MNRNLKYPAILPEWFLYLNEKSLVCSKDVAVLFGFRGVPVVKALMNKGSFPKPDCHLGGRSCSQKCQWKKATLLAEIERRKKLANASV
jgi:hypothetical protein